MKLTVQLGEYEVTVDIQRNGHKHDELDFIAACGDKTVTGRMTVTGGHEKTREQLDKDIRDFANRLALEVAEDVHIHRLTSSILEH
ncbi:MAG TPA: hypothetical protein VFC10_15915 [Terriglobia bacterium]|nr:hypothetical protein [Terriglobia bacterium]